MSTFYYTAKSLDGKTKSGTLEAKDKSNLAQALRRKGFLLTSAQILGEEKKKKKLVFSKKVIGFLSGVSLVERLLFTRHLAVMIGAGFSLHKALEVLAKQSTNPSFKKIINSVVTGIKKGNTLADGLAKHPRVFNNFYISMIRVGEKGGNLEEVLKILAEYLKKEHEFRSKVRGAMIYPIVIFIAMIGIGILMMIVVVPKITDMFEELNTELPLTTKILIAISTFLTNYFILGLIGFIVLIIILIRFLRTKPGKYSLSWIFLKLPFVKKITKKINCARFARSFSSLMESGVPIIESLNITAKTLSNVFYSDSLISIATEVKKGQNLQEALEKHSNIYPILVSQMIGVGEQTGELSDIVKRLADFYEEEVTDITNNLASVIEPVLMIIIGAAVGFLAVSMIQPMYSMMEGL